MRKIILATIVGGLFSFTNVYAQNAFWSYDENNQESFIPAQCDGQFDETHGGVFMPTPDELFDQGELFLLEKASAIVTPLAGVTSVFSMQIFATDSV